MDHQYWNCSPTLMPQSSRATMQARTAFGALSAYRCMGPGGGQKVASDRDSFQTQRIGCRQRRQRRSLGADFGNAEEEFTGNFTKRSVA